MSSSEIILVSVYPAVTRSSWTAGFPKLPCAAPEEGRWQEGLEEGSVALRFRFEPAVTVLYPFLSTASFALANRSMGASKVSLSALAAETKLYS